MMIRKVMFVLFVWLLSFTVSSAEYPLSDSFQVTGAKVQKKDGIVTVQTSGIFPNEGLAWSFAKIKRKNCCAFHTVLKGKGEVYLKIVEFAKNGDYLKESLSDPFVLSEDWKSHQLTFFTDENMTEVQAYILTTKREKAHFSIQIASFRKRESMAP
jgi:hypothetical protein